MVRIRRTAIVGLAVVVALAVGGTSVLAKGNKGGAKGTKGTVTAVDSSSITVESKKQGSQKFTVNANTVYEKAGNKKKGDASAPATLTDVQVGTQVEIEGSTDQVTKVTIAKSAKGGKGKKNK